MLVNVVAAMLLAAVLAASGSRLRQHLRLPVPLRLRLAVDVTFGSGLMSALAVTLGIAGLLHGWVLALATLALAFFGRWQRRQWELRALIAPALGAAVMLPVALAPPFFYDALIYHLGLPWQALLEGGLHSHPETIYSAAPPLFQAIATVPLAIGLERAPALLNWIAFVVAGAATDAVARSVGARSAVARLAAFCVPIVSLYVLVAGLPAAEGFGVLALTTALGVALQRRFRPGSAAAVGMALGVALAARLQVLPLAALVGLIAWFRSAFSARSVFQIGAGALIAAAPWWLKNLVLLKRPFLPVGWRGEGIDAVWRDAVSTLHTAHRLSDVVRPLGADLGPHAAYLLPLALAALLAVVRRDDARLRWLVLLLVGGLTAWDLTAAIPRYLAAWAPALLVLAAAASAIPAGRWAAALALGATAVLSLATSVVQLQRIGGLRLVLEPQQRVEQALVVNDPFPAFAAAEALPPDARVLFVGEPRGFRFPRRFITPSYYDQSVLCAPLERLPDAAGVRIWLEERGFTHLLVNWGELARLAASYPAAPFRTPAGQRRWLDLIRLLGPPVISLNGVDIFAVAPPGRRP